MNHFKISVHISLFSKYSCIAHCFKESGQCQLFQVRIALTEDGVPMSVLREISLLRHLGKKWSKLRIVHLLAINVFFITDGLAKEGSAANSEWAYWLLEIREESRVGSPVHYWSVERSLTWDFTCWLHLSDLWKFTSSSLASVDSALWSMMIAPVKWTTFSFI